MPCLDAPELFDLLAGGEGPARAELDVHLDGCATCRALVVAYARVAEDDFSEDATVVAPWTPEGAATLPSGPPPIFASRLAPGDCLGRFRLEHVVGEGGMGVVWAARDRASERLVALKILKFDTRELVTRARREAAIASTLSHPNVLPVREVLAVEGSPPVLVMDLLEGESLDRVLARRGRFPAREAIAILLPLVAAVRAAHARGVLHRDLKPSNVFLAREPGAAEPVVMLLDFGLAKLLGAEVEELTRTGAIVGTPYYMAPEQLYGEKDVDRRADVWAIGAILYELVAGRRPLEGASYGQIVRAASRRAQKPLASVAPEVPPELAALVDQMLAHDREDRPELPVVHAALEAACGA